VKENRLAPVTQIAGLDNEAWRFVDMHQPPIKKSAICTAILDQDTLRFWSTVPRNAVEMNAGFHGNVGNSHNNWGCHGPLVRSSFSGRNIL